ncbi:hypothetical protein IF803_28795 [Bradyrhizobium sp. UFLA06-06]
MHINKSDQNDAKGVARKGPHGMEGGGKLETRSMLATRTKLVNLRRDLDNKMRGLCKGLGIVLGKAGSTNLARKVNAVLVEVPDLQDGSRRCSLPSPV